MLTVPLGVDEQPRAVTEVPHHLEELAWSPDGRSLAAVARIATDPGWYETPEDRRPPLRLTTGRYASDGVGWTVNNRRQILLVDVETGAVRVVSDGTADDHDVVWAADGTCLIFASQRQEDWDLTESNQLFRLDLDTEKISPLTSATHEFVRPTPSPDGSRVAVAAVDVPHYPSPLLPAVVDLGTGQVRELRDVADRDCLPGTTAWLDDERFVTVLATGGRQEVVVITCPIDGPASMEPCLVGDRQISAYVCDPEVWVAIEAGTALPPRVIWGEHGASTEHVLHDPNAEYRRARALSQAEHLVVSHDGVDVDAWVAYPAGAGPHPLIIWLQGGGSQYGYQWSHEVQLLLAGGYAVAWLNPRGSAGYGTAWMRTLCGPGAQTPGSGWGVRDVEDVSAVVRHLASQPHIDASRVGVMGGSYGGLLTTHLLAKTDLFAAGWAERGPYNLVSDAGTKDEAPWFFEAYLGVSHVDDPGPYRAASTLTYVDGITAPLAIVHSENDRRCAVQQAEELFMALRVLRRPVEFIRFPGEGHGLTRSGRPVHRAQRANILLEWFGRWLQPAT